MSRRRLLYISTVWPEHKASAAGVRSLQLLRLFQNTGWDVACGSAAKDTTYRAELDLIGIKTVRYPINRSTELKSTLLSLRPDMVIFERFNLEEMHSWLVREVLPEAVRVIDTQDLNFLRQTREDVLTRLLAQKGCPPTESEGGFRVPHELIHVDFAAHASELVLRELSAIHRSDGALIVSDYERDLLTSQFGIASHKLELAPFFYPSPPGDDYKTSSFDSKAHFVTIGNFRHRPNADSVRWLANDVWPRVRRRLPGAQLHVYGAYPRKEDMALSCPDQGLNIKGPTKDQYDCLRRYRVMLCPLRFGAGIKGKVSDAWWCGTPVVTTPIGAEGMGYLSSPGSSAGNGVSGDEKGPWWGGAVECEAEALAAAAAKLYSNQGWWVACRERGRRILQERFEEGSSGAAVLRFVDGLLEGRRGVDWVQSMLWRDSARATEYMSRYLETKAELKQQQYRPELVQQGRHDTR